MMMLKEIWYAENFGWSPQVVRDMPLESFEWFPIILTARAESDRMRNSQQERERGGIQRLR